MYLLQRSGRNIRINLFFATLCPSGLAMTFGSGYVLAIGVVATAASFVLLWLGVSCPKCGCKWVLHFMRTSHMNDWFMIYTQWINAQSALMTQKLNKAQEIEMHRDAFDCSWRYIAHGGIE